MANQSPLLTSLRKARELVLALREERISDLHTVTGCFQAIQRMCTDAATSSVAEAARYYGEDACATLEQQTGELLAAIDAAIQLTEVHRHG